MKLSVLLFYLFLLLLPLQLGRHFFFDFSLIAGLRSDYLAPTVYLTDIIVIFMFFVWLIERKIQQWINPKHEARNPKQIQIRKIQNSKQFWLFRFRILDLFRISNFAFRIFILVICYLLFSSLFIAANTWVSLYKSVKILELILLGILIVKIKPSPKIVLLILSFGLFYSAIIAFCQFVLQRSIGGPFWFLGERQFNAGTSGIASFSLAGRLILRPYSIFPHPNVFGGFIAVVLPLVLEALLNSQKKIGYIISVWLKLVIIIGWTALLLTASRASWIVTICGFILVVLNRKANLVNWLKKKANLSLVIFFSFIFLSIVIPLFIKKGFFVTGESWKERASLIQAAINIISIQPFFGVGLNNFITQISSFITSDFDLYFFQPVHNIYLLVMSETGLIGFFIFLLFLTFVFRRGLSANSMVVVALIQLYILGFFDHYLFTLQQGQLLFTLFASLAFLKEKK